MTSILTCIRKLALLLVAIPLVAAGCGEDKPNRTAARDQAASAACEHYQKCGEIGAGKRHASMDSCDVNMRAYFETTWPPASCDGKISDSALELCLAAINLAECGSGGDFLHVLDKCQRAKVCGEPAP